MNLVLLHPWSFHYLWLLKNNGSCCCIVIILFNSCCLLRNKTRPLKKIINFLKQRQLKILKVFRVTIISFFRIEKSRRIESSVSFCTVHRDNIRYNNITGRKGTKTKKSIRCLQGGWLQIETCRFWVDFCYKHTLDYKNGGMYHH